MKNACCLFFTMCGVAFGQSVPANAASGALEARMRNMDFLNAVSANANRIVFAGPVKPNVCAAPLLRANPMATGDAMRIITPPACDENP
jgi:hypothetical protein